MPDYMELNRELWDEITPIHEKADLYDIERFKAGKTSLKQVELREVGEVSGKSLLHLMCHIGLDSISWSRLGAKVTAVDFSPESLIMARSLSQETGVDVNWVQAKYIRSTAKTEGAIPRDLHLLWRALLAARSQTLG